MLKTYHEVFTRYMEHICLCRRNSTGLLRILTLYNNIYDITVQFVALQGADCPDNGGH